MNLVRKPGEPGSALRSEAQLPATNLVRGVNQVHEFSSVGRFETHEPGSQTRRTRFSAALRSAAAGTNLVRGVNQVHEFSSVGRFETHEPGSQTRRTRFSAAVRSAAAGGARSARRRDPRGAAGAPHTRCPTPRTGARRRSWT